MTRTSKSAKERSGLLLGISLLAGLYVTVAILVLLSAVLFVPVVLALGGHVNTAVLVAAEFVAVGSVPGLMMIYYCVFTLRRSDDKHPAVEVSPGDAPELWDVVNEVAAVARTRPPTRLRVAAVANATVFEETRLLGFAGGQRYLTIGLPLLLGLTAAELRAVLAHEMGHYARGHTRLGAQVYRGSVALRNTCQALKAAREPGSHRSTVRLMWRMRSLYAYIAYGVFAVYSAFYDRVSFAARRRQELQADACAADHFGRDVTADALRAGHALPVAWSRFQNGYLEPMRKAGYLPDDPFSAFELMLCDPDFRDVLADLRQFPPEQPVSRLDSHPTLDQRLTALMDRDAEPEDPAGPSAAAMVLLSGDQRQSISRGLHREMFRGSLLSRVSAGQDLPWQEWVSAVAALQAAAPAASLVRLAGRLAGLGTATLDTVLDLLAAGRGGDLADALAEDRGDPPDAAAPVLAAALYALTGHYLVETGRAGWAVSWNGPSRLIAADIAADELSELVVAAVHRPATEVARLRLHLVSLRLNPAAHGPVTSLLRAQAEGPVGTGSAPRRQAANVRIVAGADLVAAQRISTIRVSNVVVGVITATVALFGIHAWNSSHSPPPFVPPPITRPPYTAGPLQNPDYLPGTGIGIKVTPPPLPVFSLPKLPLETTVVVKPGDSLSALACRYQTTIRMLQEMNHLGTSTLIVPGERLNVPIALGVIGTC
jgi:Zn-dependent protease with chaperone function/LysM repeat protein